MPNTERERAIAMILARRAYLYRLLHVVFGSRPTGDSVSKIFGEETLVMFQFIRETLLGDGFGRIAKQPVASSGRSLIACADDVCACIEQARSKVDSPDCAEAFVCDLCSDYDKLFQVPGDVYVHLWESPYTGKESMVFQESTLDVRSFYHAAGFRLQAEKHFPDDHIAAMMDYMGYMAQRAYEAYADGCDDEVFKTLVTQRRFADRHIVNWVDLFASAVIERDVHAYYSAFAGGMAAFVHTDRAMIERLEQELAER